MKKRFQYMLLLMLPMLALLCSCEKEEIIFDSELPQFELRPGKILLEVIVPSTTSTSDNIYIAGPFNGGETEAVKDLRWRLEKASGYDYKYGIYLDPATFAEGKTLADGYWFVSKNQGVERTVKNTESIHYGNPAPGTRTNITVPRWKAYFDNPEEITHDGHVIYVLDNSTLGDLYMYAWGDAEAFGAWPGIKETGTIAIDNVTYRYFDTGEANAGLNLNLIFNNNAGTQLADFNATLDRDYFLEITDSGVSEISGGSVEHDGYAIFIENLTGWEEVAMYVYENDAPAQFGAWPGSVPMGEETINGVKYLYFDLGAANEGHTQTFIFNNNGNNSQADGPTLTLDRNFYYSIGSDKKWVEIEDPSTYNGGSYVEPDPLPEGKPYNLYVEDKTGWDALYVYCWGDTELFGGWPGATSADTKTVNGVTYKVIPFTGAGESVNLIFNNNDAAQFDGPSITADRDYYLSITATECTEVDPGPLASTYRIYADDQTGWSAIYMYAWGDVNDFFGGWPGSAPTGTETIGGKEWKYWEFEANGEGENLIFNNGDGTQLADFGAKLDRDYYLTLTTSGCTETASPKSIKKRSKTTRR